MSSRPAAGPEIFRYRMLASTTTEADYAANMNWLSLCHVTSGP